jgi:tRNA(Ile)-lysidine synthase
VVTAHNRDDQAETILMNLIRGTGLDGLAGIPPRTGDFLARPLLGVSRSDLRELAVLARLPFVDDPSNVDVSFTRNAVLSTSSTSSSTGRISGPERGGPRSRSALSPRCPNRSRAA